MVLLKGLHGTAERDSLPALQLSAHECNLCDLVHLLVVLSSDLEQDWVFWIVLVVQAIDLLLQPLLQIRAATEAAAGNDRLFGGRFSCQFPPFCNALACAGTNLGQLFHAAFSPNGVDLLLKQALALANRRVEQRYQIVAADQLEISACKSRVKKKGT